MPILMSIKPEFAEKILSGEKKYEFRRTIFNNYLVKKVIIYASSPIQKVIGEFEITEILYCDINRLWRMRGHCSGVSEEFFYEYFKGKNKGYAIGIKNATRYEKPKCLKADFNLNPPQSFCYIKELNNE